MNEVVLVHGISQQYRGPESLRRECVAALCDGVTIANGQLDPGDVSVAFYGDLFRPQGRTRLMDIPDYDASDVDNDLERQLLRVWWQATASMEPAVPGPDELTRLRTPQWIQRALYALSRSRHFSNLSERALIGSLKQVRLYFTDRSTRLRIRQRLLDAIDDQTAVVIGHSLGSVVAYEALCSEAAPRVTTLVTLGSPLGIRPLIFDRLDPPPENSCGSWPTHVQHWTNIADDGDIVALTKTLTPLFPGGDLVDIAVHNGVRAHDIRPYLTARETGMAVLHGLSLC